MHRTTTMLRKLIGGVLAAAAMLLSVQVASAQFPDPFPPPPPNAAPEPTRRIVPIEVDAPRTIGLIRPDGAADDPFIEKVQNTNPSVCRIHNVANDPRHVLVTGVSPGVSRVVLTGYLDPAGKERIEETIEIHVAANAPAPVNAAAPKAPELLPVAFQEKDDPAAKAKKPRVFLLTIGRSRDLDPPEIPGFKGIVQYDGSESEAPDIAKVDDRTNFDGFKSARITGKKKGSTVITVKWGEDIGKKELKEILREKIEVRVITESEADRRARLEEEAQTREQRRKDFLALVRQTVPTANIDALIVISTTRGPVTVSRTSGAGAAEKADSTTEQGNTLDQMVVFLTGNVLTAESVNSIMESARAMFGNNTNIVNNMTIGGVQQIEVDCVICSINRSKLRTMSFSWALNRPDFYINSILNSNSLTNAIATSPAAVTANQAVTGGGNLAFGAITDSGSFFGFLQALRTDGLAKVQAEPKVVTLSGRPAQFLSGGETPVLTQSGNGGPSVSYRSFGVTVTVLPIVLGNGKIHLEVAPLISQLNQANGITIAGANGATVVPGFDTQGAQVAVQVEDGQTVAIGGLIQHTVNATNSRVPVLGDVPFIGAAFRSVSYNEREQELIILVTPRLVDPLACDQLPGRLPTRLTRTPDDFELYLEGLLELPRGQRQTCGPNGCYQAPHKLGPTAGVFPCGDKGSCGVTGAGLRGGACGVRGCSTGCASCSAPINGATSNGSSLNGTPAAPAVAVPTSAPASRPMPLPISESAPRPAAGTRSAVQPTPSYLPPSNIAPVGYVIPPMSPSSPYSQYPPTSAPR